MKFNKIILLAAVLVVGFSSCKKDDPEDPTTTPTTPTVEEPTTSNLGAFFDNYRTSITQSYTIDANSWQYITANEGTIITVPANAFVDAAGNPVSGSIDIEVIEVLTQADMLLTNMPTTSGGQMLISGGELNIEAFQNGQELSLAAGSSLNIMVPDDVMDFNMEMFLPQTGANGEFEDWIPANNMPVNFAVDSANVDSSGWYQFDFSETGLGWLNCDYFYNSGATLTSVAVTVPSAHDSGNTDVFLHVSGMNSLIGLTGWDAGSNSFVSYQNSIPEGLACTVVCLSEINGQMYSSFTPITVVTNHVEVVPMTATTNAQIISDLNAL